MYGMNSNNDREREGVFGKLDGLGSLRSPFFRLGRGGIEPQVVMALLGSIKKSQENSPGGGGGLGYIGGGGGGIGDTSAPQGLTSRTSAPQGLTSRTSAPQGLTLNPSLPSTSPMPSPLNPPSNIAPFKGGSPVNIPKKLPPTGRMPSPPRKISRKVMS